MADNYLERRQEELRSGRTVWRKDNPPLETLLHRLGAAHGEPADPSYLVRQAQLDALGRAAGMAVAAGSDGAWADALGLVSDEAAATLSLQHDDPFLLGQAALAARLKAAELGLRTSIRRPDSRTAVLHLFK